MGLMSLSKEKSPWIYHLNTGSCNGCDIELVALLGPRYDVERFGVKLTGSPKHADIVIVTSCSFPRSCWGLSTRYCRQW